MSRNTLACFLLIAATTQITATAAHQRHDTEGRSHEKVTSENVNPNALAWDVLGLRLAETDGTAVRNVNQRTGTRYRGAMKIEGIRSNGPAHDLGLREGDLLLGIHGWQTITANDIRGILTLKNDDTPKEPAKVKYFILRDGKTLFGFLLPTEPLTGHRTIR